MTEDRGRKIEGGSISTVKVKNAKLRNPDKSGDCLNSSLRYGRDDRGTCQDCEHSVPAGGQAGLALICNHEADTDLSWQVVNSEALCSNFERSRELVTLDIAAALAGGAKLIPLSQNKFAIVDAEDYKRLKNINDTPSKSTGHIMHILTRGAKV